MVINLARRGYCDAGVCMFVCGNVFVYTCMCARSPISQYDFVKGGTIVTHFYIEITGYTVYAQSRGKHSDNNLCKFPNVLKKAEICPIYKKGNNLDYRTTDQLVFFQVQYKSRLSS